MEHIINEYFKLTGRPIATMTVSEYLEFQSFCNDTKVITPQTSEPVKISVHEEKTESVHKPVTVPAKAEKSRKNTALEMLKSVNG